ncbi:MAG TPA: response regulator transcription factor [Casimicrobiaceae bacterium]|nr:response regulator transcription factor [Casimicrobiaceae bacterium]
MSVDASVAPLIAIADDDPLIRAAMRGVLARLDPQPRIVEAGDMDGVLRLSAADPAPDLVLVDLRMPGGQGIDGVRALRALAPQVPVAILSADEDRAIVHALLALGVAGFIPKSHTSELIVQAVQLMLAGGNYVPLCLLGSGPSPLEQTGLTGRRVEVLRLLSRGLSNKEIARELGISEGTVKVHLLGVFRLLGVRNRTQAVLASQRFLV